MTGHRRDRPRLPHPARRRRARRAALCRAFPTPRPHHALRRRRHLPGVPDAASSPRPLDRVGALRRHHRAALPLLAPVASRCGSMPTCGRVDSGWPTASHFPARTLVYCHNPARWLYQTDEYLGDPRSAPAARCRQGARRCGHSPALGPAGLGHGARPSTSPTPGGAAEEVGRRTARDAAVLLPLPPAWTPSATCEPVLGRADFGSGVPLVRVPPAAVQERRQSRFEAFRGPAR